MKGLKAFLKFVPVFVLAGLMIFGKGHLFDGQDAMIAAPLAFLAAVIIAMLVEKKKWQECLDAAMGSVSNILVALFILMLAYVMASCFMSFGVGASVVNIALKLGVTARTVACVGLVCTGVLSVATGTSWGTFAACAPIFLWLSHIVGGDIYLRNRRRRLLRRQHRSDLRYDHRILRYPGRTGYRQNQTPGCLVSFLLNLGSNRVLRCSFRHGSARLRRCFHRYG